MDQSRDAAGRYLQRRVYKDYRLVSGIQWPFYEGRSINGKPATSLQLRIVSINTGVPETRFVRPEAHAPSTHR